MNVGPGALPTPGEIEQSFAVATQTAAHPREPIRPPSATATDGGGDSEAVALLSRHGTTVAMSDLQGQTAPEPDWYRPAKFVCHECLQPCEGVCIGWPMAARLCPKTGVTQWIVRGRLGSIGCAMRYATDRRHSFWQETAGLLPLMLVRAYGMSDILTRDIPVGEPRTQLPPFQPALCAKWGRGEIRWSGDDYHRHLIVPSKWPDPRKHQIVSDHCAVLVDTLVPRFTLGLNARQLRDMFPGFITKTKPSAVATEAATAAAPNPSKRPQPQTVDDCLA